jgi:glycerol-3-phosphate dehydrogenase
MTDQRQADLQAVRENPQIPVLILGGGVNGVGLLRELALQGVDCLLVDKADFVAGSSSKSSRMIHGGLRYLENREVALVRESLYERNRLLDNAPHYVAPLRTTIPLFSWLGGLVRSTLIFFGLNIRPGGRGAAIVKLGLTFYDLVTRKDRRTPRHFFTSRRQSLAELPGLHPGIVATASYWDAKITQPERLCMELIQDARAASPACRALNYVRPVRVEYGSVLLRDEETGEELPVQPQIVVNATGAWVDIANRALGLHTEFMGGTKGSHLVIDHPELLAALDGRMIYYQHTDGRVCITYPIDGKILMGSTDIRVDDPDAARCEPDEIEYMLSTLRDVFPDIGVAREHILYTFCGVRPLPASKSGVTATISRGHTIHVLEPKGEGPPFPVVCLVGGKWTTFRALAEQTADKLLPRLSAERRTATDGIPIGGGRDYPEDPAAWVARVAEETGTSRERVEVLLGRYGTAAATWAQSDGEPLQSLPDYTTGEVRRLAAEQVVHLDDLICRRSTIAILGQATKEALAELAALVGEALGWDEGRRQAEVARALEDVRVPASS